MSSPIAFALQFHGDAVQVADGRYWAECRAPSCTFFDVGTAAPREIGDQEAVCRRELELGDGGTLAEAGEISFGLGTSITFRSKGELVASPDPGLRHGTAVCEVTGGRGRLAGARGYIASNFLLSDSGQLTDHHLGVLFVERPTAEGADHARTTS